MEDLLSFECPRCGCGVDEEYYGPCSACRDALRRAESTARRDATAEEYAPKMNVTPNAVALKDD